MLKDVRIKKLFVNKNIIFFEIILKDNLNFLEIQNKLKYKFNIDSLPSSDLIYKYFNTLKFIGIKIKRTSKANGANYQIIDHPFKIELQKQSIEFLFKLRSKVIKQRDLVFLHHEPRTVQPYLLKPFRPHEPISIYHSCFS